MNGYYKITEILKSILEVDNDVFTVNKGIIQDVLLKKADLYPYVHIIINNATNQGNINTFNVSVIAMDIVDISKEQTTDIFRGQNNRDDVLNTMFAVLSRMITIIERGDSTHLYQLTGTPNYEPFEDRFEHGVAGWTVTFDVVLPDDMTVCDFETPRDFCDASNYIISDGSGNVLYTGSIASGGTLAQVISDSTVTNSLGTVLANIDAEGTTELADVNNIDSDGSTVPTPAGVAFTCTPAEDVTFTLNTNQGTLNIPSGETVNLNLKDQDGNIITPNSFTGAPYDYDLEIEMASSYIGKTLMQTGQITSYVTGDEGSSPHGRLVDFFTLNGNNIFGNTNRFTDELGGQTYANNIMLDHSTFENDICLGVYRVIFASDTFANQITACSSLSVGSFTTGWRMWNHTEAFNFGCAEPGQIYNYTQLSLGAGTIGYIYTLNTWTAFASSKIYATANNFQLIADTIANNSKAVAVRYFTWNGTAFT